VDIARHRGRITTTLDVPGLPVEGTPDRRVTPAEFRKILEWLGDSKLDCRDRAMLSVIHGLGLRTSETARLHVRDLKDMDLSGETREAVDAWLDGRPPDAPAFPNHRGGRLTSRGVLAIVKRRAQLAGLDITARGLARSNRRAG